MKTRSRLELVLWGLLWMLSFAIAAFLGKAQQTPASPQVLLPAEQPMSLRQDLATRETDPKTLLDFATRRPDFHLEEDFGEGRHYLLTHFLLSGNVQDAQIYAKQILEGIGAEALPSIFSYLSEWPRGDLREALIVEVLEKWVRVDAHAAFSALEQWPDPQDRRKTESLLFAAIWKESPDTFKRIISERGVPRDWSGFLRHTFRDSADKVIPGDAFHLFNLETLQPRERGALLSAWYASGQCSLEWLRACIHSVPTYEQAQLVRALGNFQSPEESSAQLDHAAAYQLLMEFPDPAVRSAFLTILAPQWVHHAPLDAIAFAEATHPGTRDVDVGRVFQAWINLDPDSATTHLTSLPAGSQRDSLLASFMEQPWGGLDDLDPDVLSILLEDQPPGLIRDFMLQGQIRNGARALPMGLTSNPNTGEQRERFQALRAEISQIESPLLKRTALDGFYASLIYFGEMAPLLREALQEEIELPQQSHERLSSILDLHEVRRGQPSP